MGMMNGPKRDELILAEASVKLDRALFPLLVLTERFAPIGVVDLADRVGRDYTTVSRQLGKLEDLGLVERQAGQRDGRVRVVVATPAGKVVTDRIDAARDRLLRAGFAGWDDQEIDDLVRLMQKFADEMRTAEMKPA
jgi:DNA-binding MarR family transcriptional regulator